MTNFNRAFRRIVRSLSHAISRIVSEAAARGLVEYGFRCIRPINPNAELVEKFGRALQSNSA